MSEAQEEIVPSEDQGYRASGGGVRPSVRDRILNRRPYKSEPVTLEDDVVVEIRSMTLGERQDMFEEITDDKGVFHSQQISPQMALRCAYDPETGERVFTDDDIDNVRNVDAGYLQPIIDKANELSGNSKKGAEAAREDEAKKS